MASVAAVASVSVGASPSSSRSRFPQAGLAVTVLNSQRTAYAKLADDREVILKTLQELKSGAATVSAYRPTSSSHLRGPTVVARQWQLCWGVPLTSTVCYRRRGACVRACCAVCQRVCNSVTVLLCCRVDVVVS